MNLLLENGCITEMDCGNNFAYLLQDHTSFLSTDYKVLHSQGDSCFLKCMKMLYNGKVQFYYLVNAWKSLADMFPILDAESFMTIVSNLLADIIEVKHNGFLSCQNIDISFERIYVDPNTYKVKLVYLPISRRFFPDLLSFENELRTGLVKLISKTSVLSTPQLIQFAEDLSDGMLTLEDLLNQMKGGGILRSACEGEKTDVSKGKLQMIAMNAPERVVIDVAKAEFLIGKKSSAVDGVVTFNKMISRIHCKITRNRNEYQITDLQSANGTYVNRRRLIADRPYPIKNGDIVRLANSDFQVVIK